MGNLENPKYKSDRNSEISIIGKITQTNQKTNRQK